MQQKFEDLRANLDEFIQQTDYSMLLVRCRPEDCPFVARFLDGQDAERPESFFLVWPGEFDDESRYVSALVTFLERRMDEARSARAERGVRPFPPLPAELADERRPPAARFRGWLEFLVTLLDDASTQSFVVGLLPSACRDAAGYARLLGSIVPVSARPAWLEPLRIVAFDPKEAPLAPVLEEQQVDTVLTWEVDFSTPALTDALARDAANASLPLEQRMSCLLQLAGIDVAYRRHSDARAKFAALYEHYSSPPRPTLQAVCLHGASESLIASGEDDEARVCLERGLALCMQGNAYGPMLILLESLIRVCFRLGRNAEAESYAKSGGALAAALLHPASYAHLEELAADAQVAQHRGDDAIVTYDHARQIASAYNQFGVWKSALDKLARLHSAAGRRDIAGELERERVRVEAVERGDERAQSPVTAERPA